MSCTEMRPSTALYPMSPVAPNFVALVQVNFVVDRSTPGGFQSFRILFGDLWAQDLEIPVGAGPQAPGYFKAVRE